jgi:hypothetical protein
MMGKLRRTRWAANVAGLGQVRNTYEVLVIRMEKYCL